MPKQKSHSGAKKRFRITPSGNVKFAKPGRSHFLTGKSRSRVRKLKEGGYLQGKQAENIKSMINK